VKQKTGEIHGTMLRLLGQMDDAARLKAKRLKFMTMASMLREVSELKTRFNDLWRADGDLYWYREPPLSDRGLSVLTGIFGYHEEAERIVEANRALISLDREVFRSFLTEVIGNEIASRNLYDIYYSRGSLSIEQLAKLENRFLERYIPTFRLFDSSGFQKLAVTKEDLGNISHIIDNYDSITDILADDVRLQRQFARDFWRLYREPARLSIIGYGEISTVMQLSGRDSDADSRWLWKKMPPFPDIKDVLEYAQLYGEYRRILTEEAGLCVPGQRLSYFNHGTYYTVYAGQEKLRGDGLCHTIIRGAGKDEAVAVFKKIACELIKVYRYNQKKGKILIGFDGQLSNWILDGDKMYYIDTSSPLYRVDGAEQLNTEIFIKNSPSFLRAIVRAFFLEDVVNRYYDMRSVFIDLVANLYKEQRPDLIEPLLAEANAVVLEEGISEKPISRKEIDSYYSQDAFIWRFFQFSRRVDRFITESILRKKYTYRLPGKVDR